MLRCDQPAYLLLAGTGPLEETVRSQARHLGILDDVRFLGFRSDIQALLQLADASVLPSEQEGLPQSIMESLASEVPVIGSDIRGTHDLLADGSGILVPLGDVSTISQAMDYVIKHREEAQAMAKRGRAKMRGTHDTSSITSQYIELYSEALTTLKPASESSYATILRPD
jgi:glycosyltransferase involved in cell wall biosynthesis